MLAAYDLTCSPLTKRLEQAMRPTAEWAIEIRGHEGERNKSFSKIQLVGHKYREKTTLASKTRFSRHCFGFQSLFKAGAFRY